MDTQLLISGFIYGLSTGSVFFLLSIGLSLCFGLMRIISLDQLLYYAIGAYITYTLFLVTGNVWIGVLGGMVVSGIVAFCVERFIFLRIYERDITFTMIASFGILFAGVGAIKYIWGLAPLPVPSPISTMATIFSTEIPVYRLVVILISILVYFAIWAFLNKTITGKAIRAGIENVEHVEGLGINVYKLFTTTFIIAGVLSGLMVVIIGGLGSIKGTLVSAFIVGQVISLGSIIYAPLAQMAPFAIMLLILLIKPTGLYGSKMLKR